jgi:hypothetical protein
MRTKPLFVATAVIEAGAGLALLVSPALTVWILIGATFDAPAESVVGRVAGAALLAWGLCCWVARNDDHSRAGRGIVLGMLLYHAVTVMVLAEAGIVLHLSGIGLWPAVVLHAVMSVWCLACLVRIARSTN